MVTIGKLDVLIAIRVSVGGDSNYTFENEPPSIQSATNSMWQACVNAIQRYAPSAPNDDHNLAMVRLFGHLWDRPFDSRRVDGYLRASGVMALLGPYRSRKPRIV